MTFFELDGKIYLKVTPTKRLFNSTTIHEVVNRGDVFAVRVEDMTLTVLSGELVSKVEKQGCLLVSLEPAPMPIAKKEKKVDTVTVAKMKKAIAETKEVLANAQSKLEGI